MDHPEYYLQLLLGTAVLLPLLSFLAIFALGPAMGKAGQGAGYVATGAIVLSLVLSLAALSIWLSEPSHHRAAAGHHGDHSSSGEHGESGSSDDEQHADNAHPPAPSSYAGQWYTLAEAGRLRLSIGYYIDALTVVMFCMVTLIAACIHFYSIGYMHEELYDFTDHEVTTSDGSHLHRPGRFHRFFQYMSLFCFSMLGLVISGNLAMTFVFWELVGICSYFLIGFYVERNSASSAANKAFIVNRIGDFGMLVGLMAIWASLGTFTFGDAQVTGDDGTTHRVAGLFSLVRPAGENHHKLVTPDGMVRFAARENIAELVRSLPPDTPEQQIEAAIAAKIPEWRDGTSPDDPARYGYWLLIVAGVGIFCGCVGKSAQFPLHTWLPDAMEGPTPVSALVHSATMVAAGVYLVARFFPMFAPEVLLVIAIAGAITLFMAATIAITATDIKRVLAYSTISQLGYMMLGLGLGGWLAGVLHLLTHAFFKSLLFLCSGSVIHAVHTNEMTQMGGLRKKMPWTAYTMLVGCLAISGAGIPFVIGLSGFYSKDAILEQAFSFGKVNEGWRWMFFFVAAGGAAITSFYMFRLWYMTFAGKPRDEHRYEHAHESPPVMYVPLVILAVFAVCVAWPFPGLNLRDMLESARPAGTLAATEGVLLEAITWPNEHDNHQAAIATPVTLIALGTALAGFFMATMFYGLRRLDPAEVRGQFWAIHRFLLNKWWFDELYDALFVRPTLLVSRLISAFDRRWIDGLIDGTARCVRLFSNGWDLVVDRTIVDGLANLLARWTHAVGISLREIQTGKLRQYVLFIVIGTVAIFVLVSFFWSTTLAK